MRILIDLTALADNFSGIERYALNISKNMIKLSKKDSFILIFKNSIHKEFEEFIDKNNVDIKVLKGGNKLVFNQIILPYHLYKYKSDKYVFLAFPSPIFFRKKGIVNTIHDLTAFLYPETMKKSSMLYFKYSIINAIKTSEEIITVSQSSKNDIERKFNGIDVKVIYNGISDVFKNFNFDEKINKFIKEKYSIPEEYIMSLGTLEPRKNIKLLIESFLQLKKQQIIECKLLLVGRKGWNIEELFNDYKEFENEILFTGFVEDEYLPYIYNNCEVFVFPSLYEGFGIPVLEAMYMNKLVLASNSSSLPEVVGEKELLFENNNKEHLKELLIKIMKFDKTKKDNITGKLKKNSLKFKWEIEANKLLNILKERNEK